MYQGTRRATERTNQTCAPEARATSLCRRDNGFSVVEVLASIVLLGTAGVAILGAVEASAQGATTQRQQADSQAVIAAGSEVLMGIKPAACTSAASTYLPQSA
jgi:Tfp pilus assembly protein PilV